MNDAAPDVTLMTPREAIQEAVKRMGGQVMLAGILGIKQPAISQWIRQGFVPVKHVLTLERLSGVPRWLLNPRVYPREPMAKPVSEW